MYKGLSQFETAPYTVVRRAWQINLLVKVHYGGL